MNATLPIILVDDESVAVTPNAQHEFTLTSKDVARGYGVSPEVIRQHKSRNGDELAEGKHWITVTNSNGGSDLTLWTKRGLIRLGFFIRSERAKRFRDAAEDLVLGHVERAEARASHLLQTTGALIALGVSADLAANLAAGACSMPRAKPSSSGMGPAPKYSLAEFVALLGTGEMAWTEWRDAAVVSTGVSVKYFERLGARMRDMGMVSVRHADNRAWYRAATPTPAAAAAGGGL